MGCVKRWLSGLTIDFVYFIEANVDLVRPEAGLYTCTSILFAATLSEDLCIHVCMYHLHRFQGLRIRVDAAAGVTLHAYMHVYMYAICD